MFIFINSMFHVASYRNNLYNSIGNTVQQIVNIQAWVACSTPQHLQSGSQDKEGYMLTIGLYPKAETKHVSVTRTAVNNGNDHFKPGLMPYAPHVLLRLIFY